MNENELFEETKNRIELHFSWRPNSHEVGLMWKGYIAALLEFGHISPNIHKKLDDILPKIAKEEIYEIFSGEPINDEQRSELQ